MSGGASLSSSEPPSSPIDGPDPRSAMAALANQINEACDATACIIAWQCNGGRDSVATPATFSREQSRTILAAVEHEFARCNSLLTGLIHLLPGKTGSLLSEGARRMRLPARPRKETCAASSFSCAASSFC